MNNAPLQPEKQHEMPNGESVIEHIAADSEQEISQFEAISFLVFWMCCGCVVDGVELRSHSPPFSDTTLKVPAH